MKKYLEIKIEDTLWRYQLLENVNNLEFISFNKDKIIKSKFNQIIMPIWDLDKFYKMTKPFGGLWAGKYHPEEKYLSDWDAYLHNMEYSISGKRPSKRAVKFTLKENANILVIDDINDLENILEVFEFNQYLCEEINKQAKLNLDISKFTLRKINFQQLSQIVDGIYLTRKGAEELAWHKFFNKDMNIIVDYTIANYEINLYDWCVESLLLFNINCIEKQESLKINTNQN